MSKLRPSAPPQPGSAPSPSSLPPLTLPPDLRRVRLRRGLSLHRGVGPGGALEPWRAPSSQACLPPPCPSGVVPEDQAPYICEAQNVFGKVQAETRLVVTGHGSLGDLGGRGTGEGGHSRGHPHGHPSFGTDVCRAGCPGSSTCGPASWAGPWGGEGGASSPQDHPQEPGATNTVSSPHSAPPGRQQRRHRPGAGEAARVPALCHPGREAVPREALAQGRPAGECGLPGCGGRWCWSREGAAPFTPWPPLCCVPGLECPLPSPASFLPLPRTFSAGMMSASSPGRSSPLELSGRTRPLLVLRSGSRRVPGARTLSWLRAQL